MAEQIGANFDPDTLALLKRVLVEAEQSIPIEARTSAVKVQIAFHILKAARGVSETPYDCDRPACAEWIHGLYSGRSTCGPHRREIFDIPVRKADASGAASRKPHRAI